MRHTQDSKVGGGVVTASCELLKGCRKVSEKTLNLHLHWPKQTNKPKKENSIQC